MTASTLSEFPPFFSLMPTRYAELQREVVELRLQVAGLRDQIERERNRSTKYNWYAIKVREIERLKERHAAEIELLTANPYEALKVAWKAHQRRYPEASQRFWATIRQAYQRGIRFDIEPDLYESLVAQPCCRCGGSTGKGVGLDRIEWRLGYIEGNVRPMCGPCNIRRGRKSDEI